MSEPQALTEALEAYTGQLHADLPGMALTGLLTLLGVTAYRRWAALPGRSHHDMPAWLGFLAALCVGLRMVMARASLFDDAFISFRYAANLLAGHGLVWNVGERVEGYTNFLWTVLVAAVTWLSGAALEEVGLWLSVGVFGCNLFVCFLLERALAGSKPVFPLATGLLAMQGTFVTAGTTGLETGFATLWVTTGALLLLRAESPLRWTLPGLAFVLATLSRPDHALFYATGGLAVLWTHRGALWRPEPAALRAGLGAVLGYVAPLLLVLGHLAWRRAYYGEWLPNTYYAKSAGRTYYAQGLIYTASFYLASHLWAVLPVFLGWLAWPTRRAELQRYKVMAGAGALAYSFYVLRLGGDFMFGRFFVVLIPLLLCGVAQAARDLLASKRRPAWVAGAALVALLGASAGGTELIPPRQIRWGIANERTFYPLEQDHPVAVGHSLYRLGKVIERWTDAGVQLRLAAGAIGMIGYYSRQELIDLAGLTDHHVARQALGERGRPGHERHADPEYIAERLPHLVRGKYTPRRWRALATFDFGRRTARRPWFIYHYESAVMDRIKALSPEVRFTRFEDHLERYIARAAQVDPAELERDAGFYQRYYFDHNDNPRLRARWQAALEAARERKHTPLGPAGEPQ